MKAIQYAGILLGVIVHIANAAITFDTFDSLMAYASIKSTVIKSGAINLSLAKKTKIAAIFSIPDISGVPTASFTDNTKLPVTLFPAEMFGGAPGTTKEVKMGIQYNTSLSANIEIKLLNVPGVNNLAQADFGYKITEVDNRLALKSFSENLASIYYNILNLNEQIMASQINASNADTIYQITLNRFNEGLTKQQYVNDARITVVNANDLTSTYRNLLRQQHLLLRILCDIPDSDSIEIVNASYASTLKPVDSVKANTMEITSTLLKEQLAKRTLDGLILANKLPVLSLFYSNTFQQYNTVARFYDANGTWHKNSSIGLRLTMNPPPFSSNQLTQKAKTQSNYDLAKQNTQHAKVKSESDYKQLKLDYETAGSKVLFCKEIFNLNTDTYIKNLVLYRQGLISMEDILHSANSLASSHYAYISALINVMYSQTKITINNRMN